MASTKKKVAKKPTATKTRSVTLEVTISGELLQNLETVATADRTKKSLPTVVHDALEHHVRDRFGFIFRKKSELVVKWGRAVRV